MNYPPIKIFLITCGILLASCSVSDTNKLHLVDLVSNHTWYIKGPDVEQLSYDYIQAEFEALNTSVTFRYFNFPCGSKANNNIVSLNYRIIGDSGIFLSGDEIAISNLFIEAQSYTEESISVDFPVDDTIWKTKCEDLSR